MSGETKRFQAAAVVLAGGKSSRMGQDKSLLAFGGQPLVQRIVQQLVPLFEEVIVGGDPDRLAFLACQVVSDEKPDQGPLMGIVSCLAKSGHDLNFVTACDIPEMNAGLIATLVSRASEVDVAIPRSDSGQLEPLFAVYRKSVIGPARRLLAASKRAVVDLIPLVRVEFVQMPEGDWYRNLNTMRDYKDALNREERRRTR